MTWPLLSEQENWICAAYSTLEHHRKKKKTDLSQYLKLERTGRSWPGTPVMSKHCGSVSARWHATAYLHMSPDLAPDFDRREPLHWNYYCLCAGIRLNQRSMLVGLKRQLFKALNKQTIKGRIALIPCHLVISALSGCFLLLQHLKWQTDVYPTFHHPLRVFSSRAHWQKTNTNLDRKPIASSALSTRSLHLHASLCSLPCCDSRVCWAAHFRYLRCPAFSRGNQRLICLMRSMSCSSIRHPWGIASMPRGNFSRRLTAPGVRLWCRTCVCWQFQVPTNTSC